MDYKEQIEILEKYRIMAIEAASMLTLNPYALLPFEALEHSDEQVRRALSSVAELSSLARERIVKLLEEDTAISRGVVQKIKSEYLNTKGAMYGEKPF